MASADIFLNPSLTEAFGNVTLEGMAAGLAVVAADVASATNLIRHGVNGLISPCNPQHFSAHVGNLIANSSLRQRFGLAARDTACGWTWDKILDSVLESYAMIFDRKQAGPSAATMRTAA